MLKLSNKFKQNAGALGMIGGVAALGIALLGGMTGEMGINPFLTAPESAKNTLEANGFKQIEITGYGWLACGFGEDTDLLRTSFTAVNANNKKVSGTVCEGLLFKGATLRDVELMP